MKVNAVFVFVIVCIGSHATAPVNDELYALAEHHEASPKDSSELLETSETRNYNSNNTFIAIPLSEVGADTKILHDKENNPVLVQTPAGSDEELMTADSIVFRPLFAYRKQQAKRMRIQAARRNYNSSPGYYQRRRVYYVPSDYWESYRRQSYYPSYYRTPQRPQRRRQSYYPDYVRNAEFPVLA